MAFPNGAAYTVRQVPSELQSEVFICIIFLSDYSGYHLLSTSHVLAFVWILNLATTVE